MPTIVTSGLIRVKSKASIENAVWDAKTNKIKFGEGVKLTENIEKATALLNQKDTSAQVDTNYLDIKRGEDGHITALSVQMFKTLSVSHKGTAIALEGAEAGKFRNIYAYLNERNEGERDENGNDAVIQSIVDSLTKEGFDVEYRVGRKKMTKHIIATMGERVSNGKVIECIYFPEFEFGFNVRVYIGEGNAKVFRNIDAAGIEVKPRSQ